MSKAIATFDYSEVDKDTKGKLINLAGQIRSLGEKWLDAGMKVADVVHQAHELLADKRKGLFADWVELEAKFCLSTAYNLNNVWERHSDFPIVGKLPQTAAYLLAAPSTPDSAIKAVEKAVNRGETITVKMVKMTIKECTDPKPSGGGKGSTKPPADKPTPPAASDPPVVESIQPPAVTKDAAKAESNGKKISGGTTFDTAELTSESIDHFGNEPPDELKQVFELRAGFKEQRAKLASIKTWMTQNANHPGALVLSSADQRIRTDIDQADSELKFCAPYCVCVYCHNKKPKVADCNACKGQGWITEPIYKAAPKGMQREKAKC